MATSSLPQIPRAIELAFSINRKVGHQHVRRTADLLIECAKEAVDHRVWLEAVWLAN